MLKYLECADDLHKKQGKGKVDTCIDAGAVNHAGHTCAVRVVLRIRPFTAAEIEGEEEQVVHARSASGVGELANFVYLQGPGTQQLEHDGKSTLKFQCDYVLPSEASQQATFKALGEGMVDTVRDGIRGCIFAYGQTGTGKSHTIFGNLSKPEQHGLMPRICESLFSQLGQFPSLAVTFSYLEIYNETMRDLLRPVMDGVTSPALEVHQHPEVGVFVEGLSRNAVYSFVDVLRLLDFGNKMRTIASTNVNANSSRSHAVLTLHIERATVEGVKRRSQLQLVDLAGSERLPSVKAGESRFTESKYINTSLWALGVMISSLGEATVGKGDVKFVPYRNSKLTHLLSDSLVGSCRTVMIACCSPASSSHDMTEQTLRLASKAKSLRTRPLVNEELDDALANSLRAEVEELRLKLSSAVSSEQKKAIKASIGMMSSLHMDMSMIPEELKLQARKIEDDSHWMLRSMGLITVPWAAWMRGEKPRLEGAGDPCLVNVCSDPLLSGCLLYSLPRGRVVTIGSDSSAAMQIDGPGVQRQMCQIVNRDGYLIELSVDSWMDAHHGNSTSSRPGLFKTGLVQVFVNNMFVVGQAQLKHNDLLRVGSSHSFRLFTENIEQLSSIMGAMELALPAISPEDAMAGEQEVRMQARYGSQMGSAIYAKLQGVRPLVEEANDLTAELRADKDFEPRFRAEVFSNVLVADEQYPEVVVVLRRRSRQCEPQDFASTSATQPQGTVICLLTVDKFRHRLEVMRDIYHVVNERAQPWGRDDDPNPWMEDAEVPLVNPALSTTRSPGCGFSVDPGQAMAANAALQAELEQMRSQIAAQSDELEIMASLRNKLVQEVVAARGETAKLQVELDRKEAGSKEAKAVARQEEVRAVLKPGWLNVLGALRERCETIQEPKMHSYLEPHERLMDYAKDLSCDVERARAEGWSRHESTN